MGASGINKKYAVILGVGRSKTGDNGVPGKCENNASTAKRVLQEFYFFFLPPTLEPSSFNFQLLDFDFSVSCENIGVALLMFLSLQISEFMQKCYSSSDASITVLL